MIGRLAAPRERGYLSPPTTGPADHASCLRSSAFSLRFSDSMGTFLVEGGRRLEGRIRPAGNKNAALPCLAATVLASEPVTLENVPRIRDVETFLKIIESLGADVRWSASNEVTIDAAGIRTDSVDADLAKRLLETLAELDTPESRALVLRVLTEPAFDVAAMTADMLQKLSKRHEEGNLYPAE